jgi:hypothetical protein
MINFFKKNGVQIAQWLFLTATVLFVLKLIFLLLPKLSVLATFAICLIGALVFAVAYIMQLSRNALMLQDKLQEVFHEQEKLQPMIETCVGMHQAAIKQIHDLKNVLALYDNDDMKKMVNVLIACQNSVEKIGGSFKYVSSLFDVLAKNDSVQAIQPPDRAIPPTTTLRDDDRQAIEALLNDELFKEN